MTNKDAIKILKSKMNGSVDNSYEWAETVRLAINALEAQLSEEGTTFGKWIPCKERLPDYHDEVLVTSRGEVAIAWLYLDGNWRSSDMPEPMYKDILAWMPLPEPYVEDERR